MTAKVFTCFLLFLHYALMGCLANYGKFHKNETSKKSPHPQYKVTPRTVVLEDSTGENLVSANEKFELGFFTPTNESSNNGRYLGIWYHNVTPRTVVWVANRNRPLPDSTGMLAISSDGNFQVLDKSGTIYWTTNEQLALEERGGIRKNSTKVELTDSGNLVLRYNLNQSEVLKPIWQSLEEPVDTLVSGTAGFPSSSSFSLNSWKNEGDPAPGKFNFIELYQNGYVILDQETTYWQSGDEKELFTGTNARPTPISDYLSSLTESKASGSTTWRLVMNSTGELQYWILDDAKQWNLEWRVPRDRCDTRDMCGIFGSCNVNNNNLCKCLPGFSPVSPEKWDSADFSDGCKRDDGIGGPKDTFLTLSNMKVRKSDPVVYANGDKCREKCLNSTQCRAYVLVDKACWVWTEDLKNLQEDYIGGANKLYIRVNTSSIKPTSRSCDPCGTNLIPYPLSTGSGCGEPAYNKFHCNTSSGKTSFTAPEGAYDVTRVEKNTRTFFIQVKESNDCGNRNQGVNDSISHLNQTLSPPFTLVNVTNLCDSMRGTDGYNDFTGVYELEISWEPPPEPTCILSSDCKDWPNSNCKISKDHKKRCLCNTDFKWNSSALSCTQGSGKGTPVSLIVGTSIGGVVVVLSCCIFCSWLFTRKLTKSREGWERFRNEALYNTEKRIKELIDSEKFTEEDGKGNDVHFIDFGSILEATDNFSDANKLGQGGFGPVYKGKFPGGQEIAIKRLSAVSGQGLEEFKNEVVLIARLQHRNLVRLLGYCLKGDEKILLYEYMPNKSLDLFLFDSQHSNLLTWEKRFDIILGVARGVLYLHQDSRLRIVHRDLKTSNILLDEELNPKISDFGLAKMVAGKQNEGSTERVIGTFGYMSPEYRLEGLFSVKSDVFSFGVVILEILSGKKNSSYFNLLDYAWRLWEEDKTMELMEEKLGESCNHAEFVKCVNVALLCLEENPADRPTMSSVVVLLSSETETFPAPKKPACITRGSHHSTDPSSASSSKHEALSITLSMLEEGR